MVWFPRRKEHRRRGTARKIANWYTENINKTAVRIPMIYCKVWLNSFDSVYPLAARTTLALREPPMFSLFFSFMSLIFFSSLARSSTVAKLLVVKLGTANDTNVSCYNPSPFPVVPLQLPAFTSPPTASFYSIWSEGMERGMRAPKGRLGMILQSNRLCIFSCVSTR